MQQLLTGNIWEKVNNEIGEQGKVSIAIAYVSSAALELKAGDVLLCNASDAAIKSGQTSAKVLQEYHEKGVAVFSNPTIHCKMLLANTFVVVGSANLSANSANYLTESAVLSEDRALVSQVKSFFHNLKRESERLSAIELDRLAQLPVSPRKPVKIKPSKVRDLEFGSRYWFLNTRELSEEIQLREASSVEKAQQEILETHGLQEDRLSYIRIVGDGHFKRNVKEGDQIMEVSEVGKNRAVVSSFFSVLKVQPGTNWMRVYYDSEEMGKELSWTAFNKIISKTPLKGILKKTSFREISVEQAEELERLLG